MGRSRAEQEREFTEFVAARGAALGRTAYLLTGDHHHAEDLLQTALVEAARRWERLDEPEAYVRRTLYTRNISRWRRSRFREVELAEHHDEASAPHDPSLRITLEQALARLTDRQRTVLVLRYFDDLTEVETARVLGISPGTVKSTNRQALSKLRALAPELAELVGALPGGDQR
jgi:RNA polymerase sigma-70 factor (sigma-E family)